MNRDVSWGDLKIRHELPEGQQCPGQRDSRRGAGAGTMTPEADRAIVRVTRRVFEVLKLVEPDDGREGENCPDQPERTQNPG